MTVSTSTRLALDITIKLEGTEAQQIHKAARQRGLTMDALIEDAIRAYLVSATEESGWSALSLSQFQQGLDNDEDSIYDNWRELYGAAAR